MAKSHSLRLKYDLFDRRFQLYKAVNDLRSKLVGPAGASEQRITVLNKGVNRTNEREVS